MNKVLILSYYWPPSGGAGVQRWMRFCKYLKQCNWEPVVYAPENALYPVFDKKLVKEVESIRVIKYPITEPHGLFNLNPGKKGGYSYRLGSGSSRLKAFKTKLGWFVRGNFFIPDARFLWIKPSVKYLTDLLRKEKFDAIISTGPPHSLHLIAAGIKKEIDIPWLADFRDPWTSMDYYKEMPLMKWADRKHHRLEKLSILGPDQLVVVGKAMQREFEHKYGRKAEIVHNGYEATEPAPTAVALTAKFTIVHIGTFLPKRNCDELWEVIAKMKKENQKFRESVEIKLIGNVDKVVIDSIERFGLSDVLNRIEYMPFNETQDHLFSAQLLLLPIDKIPNAEFVLTGKLFEYLKSHRPVLLIGPPDGDAADIIRSCAAGYIAGFNDTKAIENILTDVFQKYLDGKNEIQSKNIESYSAIELTKKLALLLDQLK